MDGGTRWAMVHATEAGRKHKSTFRRHKSTAKQLGVTIFTVLSGGRRHSTTDAADIAPKSGRRRVISVAAALRANEWPTDGAIRSAREAATKLHVVAFTGSSVYSTTSARTAKSYGQSISQPSHTVSAQPQNLLTKDTKVTFQQDNFLILQAAGLVIFDFNNARGIYIDILLSLASPFFAFNPIEISW